jgi:hypothetical protein
MGGNYARTNAADIRRRGDVNTRLGRKQQMRVFAARGSRENQRRISHATRAEYSLHFVRPDLARFGVW